MRGAWTMAAAGVVGFIGTAAGQCVSVSMSPPTLDRWAYPFNSTPGAETSASTFGAIRQAGFDDRDAQILIGWDTGGMVPTGLDPSRYEVRRARVTVFVSVSDRFFYDPTADSVRSLYDPADAEYVADADPGRPVELYGVGYRNGMTSATFGEATPLAPVPPFPPQEGVRSVYAAVFDGAGVATDVSRQVRQRFESRAMALGMCEGLAPGDRPAAGTAMTFEVDMTDAATRAYWSRSVAEGRVRVMVTSLEPAAGGPGGGTGTPTYPAFYTKENALSPVLGYGARLEMDVTVWPVVDVNNDGNVDQDDVAYLINVIGGGQNPTGVDPDLNGDGNVDQDDVRLLVDLVAGGSPCR